MRFESSSWYIAGSGFGLYGYVPALLRMKQKIFLPLEKRAKMAERNDLAPLIDQINWLSSRQLCMKLSTKAIVAVPPDNQKDVLNELVTFGQCSEVILEKPICTNPTSAILLTDFAFQKFRKVTVNYSFLLSSWVAGIRKICTKSTYGKIKITWSFTAHHYENNLNNWKRYHNQGGGALRFYAIHLIAVLGELPNVQILSVLPVYHRDSSLRAVRIVATSNDIEIDMDIDTLNTNEQFLVSYQSDKFKPSVIIKSASDPFENVDSSTDNRIPFLISLIKNHGMKKQKITYKKVKKINYLWSKCEKLLM